MEREQFLDSVANRLGRARIKTAPERAPMKAPWPPQEGSLSARFTRELHAVGGTCERAESLDELVSLLGRGIFAASGAPVVAARRSVFESLGLDTHHAHFRGVSFWGDAGCNSTESFRQRALVADLGVSGAICGISSTGTLFLSASADSPRSVSLLPRRHLAVLRESQLVFELDAAFSLATRGAPSPSSMPSALYCITGPSRTSDIENDLSIGVHGPAEVHVILYREAEA